MLRRFSCISFLFKPPWKEMNMEESEESWKLNWCDIPKIKIKRNFPAVKMLLNELCLKYRLKNCLLFTRRRETLKCALFVRAPYRKFTIVSKVRILCFRPEIPFSGKLNPKNQNYQSKFKIVCLKWNLLPILIRICRIQLWFSFCFSVLDQIYPFWASLFQKIKIVSLSWNSVYSLIKICRSRWWFTFSFVLFCLRSEITF